MKIIIDIPSNFIVITWQIALHETKCRLYHLYSSDAVAGASVTGNSSTSSFVPDEGSVEQLINFGFTRPQCVKALKCTNGNMERAADWLFNHPDDTGKII